MSYCHGLGGNQVFAYTKRQQVMSDDNCLDVAGPSSPVKLVRCHGMGGNQAWVFNKMDNSLRHVNTGKCLTTQTQDPGNGRQGEYQLVDLDTTFLLTGSPVLESCSGAASQQWLMEDKFKWQAGSS